jgi:hypothetical protein
MKRPATAKGNLDLAFTAYGAGTLSFVPVGIGTDGQRAVPQHPQRRPTFRGDVASAPLPETAAEPLTPERDPCRIPIRTVSRRAIEALVASFNRTARHAE